MNQTNTAYLKGLIAILKSRDVDALRDFLKEEAASRDPSRIAEVETISDEDLEKRMYKMILARPELGELHAEARRWLREHDAEVRF